MEAENTTGFSFAVYIIENNPKSLTPPDRLVAPELVGLRIEKTIPPINTSRLVLNTLGLERLGKETLDLETTYDNSFLLSNLPNRDLAKAFSEN